MAIVALRRKSFELSLSNMQIPGSLVLCHVTETTLPGFSSHASPDVVLLAALSLVGLSSLSLHLHGRMATVREGARSYLNSTITSLGKSNSLPLLENKNHQSSFTSDGYSFTT